MLGSKLQSMKQSKKQSLIDKQMHKHVATRADRDMQWPQPRRMLDQGQGQAYTLFYRIDRSSSDLRAF